MSWRTVLRANARTVVADYATSSPDTLRAVYSTRPGGFPETPAAYIGDIALRYVHDVQTKRTEGEISIVIVENAADNAEATSSLDIISDALEDAFTAAPHALFANTVSEPVRSESLALDVGGVPYNAVVLTIGRIVILEGRT